MKQKRKESISTFTYIVMSLFFAGLFIIANTFTMASARQGYYWQTFLGMCLMFYLIAGCMATVKYYVIRKTLKEEVFYYTLTMLGLLFIVLAKG